ncbi:MAG: hypothetical protein EBS53_13045 [Bacteroidetes bacterium]|nr:hypothetical protein [Bacteroidota bacterium]
MPLIETKGAASAQGFGEFTVVGPPPNYIEDVFSTWLYTGNGSTQTINNGIDLAGKGGLVWMKARSIAYPNFLIDTVRGRAKPLSSDTADAASTSLAGYDLTSFNSTGFSLGPDWVAPVNTSNDTFASWTFREQPKFFDVVTYTGNGSNRTISHNLGSTPGCIIVKRTDASANWQVYHRSLTSAAYSMQLNLTNTEASATTVWNSTAPTSTVFSVGTDSTVNANGGTYVAYLFAHNAGGFGLAGTDNVISCGSYTGGGSGSNTTVTLGYEPQWVLIKRTDTLEDWNIGDNMRGSVANNSKGPFLWANNSGAEASYANAEFTATATGFQLPGSNSGFNALGGTYIYIAIRRGPMKTPTSGTSVYNAVQRVGNSTTTQVSLGLTPDWVVTQRTDSASQFFNYTRLRGPNLALYTNLTDAEATYSNSLTGFNNISLTVGTDPAAVINQSTWQYIYWTFSRAPSFFDVVCYTGTGVNGQTFNHNLGVAPELLIVKKRFESPGVGGSPQPWVTLLGPISSNGNVKIALLNQDTTAYNDNTGAFSSEFYQTMPSASVFTLGNSSTVNRSTYYFVAYLFATCAGVSKVGSYTGTGALQTINCGFTGGVRFVLIKRTDSTGDWYVYDSARGISSSNDPYYRWNTNLDQVTNTNYVDTTSVGFQVTAAAPAGLNANGGTYIFLAIA